MSVKVGLGVQGCIHKRSLLIVEFEGIQKCQIGQERDRTRPSVVGEGQARESANEK